MPSDQLRTVLMLRYFTGNTKTSDGKVEFTGGVTSLGDAVDGVVKIFTIAVSLSYGCLSFLLLVFLLVAFTYLWNLSGYHCGCCSARRATIGCHLDVRKIYL